MPKRDDAKEPEKRTDSDVTAPAAATGGEPKDIARNAGIIAGAIMGGPIVASLMGQLAARLSGDDDAPEAADAAATTPLSGRGAGETVRRQFGVAPGDPTELQDGDPHNSSENKLLDLLREVPKSAPGDDRHGPEAGPPGGPSWPAGGREWRPTLGSSWPPSAGSVDRKLEQGSRLPSLDDKIKAILALPSDDYDGRAAAAASLNAATRSLLAEQLAPALNARIQSMPHETLEQKKELARWVNDQLEPLGLAIQCPNTRLPGKLWGIKGSYKPGDMPGSFCIEVRKKGKLVKSAYFDTLPELTLMDATPLQEPEKDWQQAVGPRESRPGRTLA